MNILAIKLENVENLVSLHFTGKWRRLHFGGPVHRFSGLFMG